MSWVVKLTKDAQNDFSALGVSDQIRVKNKLRWLGTNFSNITPAPLKGRFADFYKLRVGSLRIFYKID